MTQHHYYIVKCICTFFILQYNNSDLSYFNFTISSVTLLYEGTSTSFNTETLNALWKQICINHKFCISDFNFIQLIVWWLNTYELDLPSLRTGRWQPEISSIGSAVKVLKKKTSWPNNGFSHGMLNVNVSKSKSTFQTQTK